MIGQTESRCSSMYLADRRAHGLDFLRLVAAVAVTAFHYRDAMASFHGVAAYGYIGVPIFFSLSGFLIVQSAQGRTRFAFVRARIARIEPAFIVSLLITGIMVDATFPQMIANLTFKPDIFGYRYVEDAYWSLYVEATFYALVCALLIGTRFNTRARWFVVAWLVASAVPFPQFVRTLFALEWAPYFCFGIAAFLWLSARHWLDLALLVVAWLASLEAAHRQAVDAEAWIGDSLDPIIAAAVAGGGEVVLLLLALAQVRRSLQGTMVIAGAISYPLYLLHHEFGRAVYELLSAELPRGLVASLTVIASCFVITRLEVRASRWIRSTLRNPFDAFRPRH